MAVPRVRNDRDGRRAARPLNRVIGRQFEACRIGTGCAGIVAGLRRSRDVPRRRGLATGPKWRPGPVGLAGIVALAAVGLCIFANWYSGIPVLPGQNGPTVNDGRYAFDNSAKDPNLDAAKPPRFLPPATTPPVLPRTMPPWSAYPRSGFPQLGLPPNGFTRPPQGGDPMLHPYGGETVIARGGRDVPGMNPPSRPNLPSVPGDEAIQSERPSIRVEVKVNARWAADFEKVQTGGSVIVRGRVAAVEFSDSKLTVSMRDCEILDYFFPGATTKASGTVMSAPSPEDFCNKLLAQYRGKTLSGKEWDAWLGQQYARLRGRLFTWEIAVETKAAPLVINALETCRRENPGSETSGQVTDHGRAPSEDPGAPGGP